MPKKSKPAVDPAVEAFERYKRADRASDLAYERLDAAEDEYWKPPHRMPHADCVFPDAKQDAERQEYTRRYESARKAAGLADFDAARSATVKEY